jgi:membrane protease YdiL (CAAX protease family)
MTNSARTLHLNRRADIWILLAVGAFIVNDLALLPPRSYGQWLVLDYGFRVLVLILILAPPSVRQMTTMRLDRKTTFIETVIKTAAIQVPVIILALLAARFLGELWPESKLAVLPQVGARYLYWWDLTAGLVLVAISEELVFRKLLWRTLTSRGWSRIWVVLASSAVFALAHWSYGIGAAVGAFLVGVLLMLLYRSTGILTPCVLVHYLTNLFLFTR